MFTIPDAVHAQHDEVGWPVIRVTHVVNVESHVLKNVVRLDANGNRHNNVVSDPVLDPESLVLRGLRAPLPDALSFRKRLLKLEMALQQNLGLCNACDEREAYTHT